MQIKYIGYYDTAANVDECRKYALSATSKMDYICSALNRAGHEVLIVSPSHTTKRQFVHGKRVQVREDVALKLFPSIPWGSAAEKFASLMTARILLFLYLIINTRKNEPILIYHSLALMNVIRLAKRLTGFKMILEVEEIYQDAQLIRKRLRDEECATFRAADAFVFSTELLDEKLNTGGKPHAVVYGTYKRPEQKAQPANDGRTHVVYAGTLDPRKGGAAAAAAAAAYLDSSFHIHILGFGSDSDIAAMKRTVSRASAANAGLVTYDGVLTGADYSEFLQKCDIGLSTQDPSAQFNATSFPSKILSYLAHGLKVVTVRIPAVERSRIAPAVTFYDHQEPTAIAEAIREAVSTSAGDNAVLIRQLDLGFTFSLGHVIEEVQNQGACR